MSPVCSAVSQSGPLLHPESLQLKRSHSYGEGAGNQSIAGNRPRGQTTGLDPGRVTLPFRITNLGNHTKKSISTYTGTFYGGDQRLVLLLLYLNTYGDHVPSFDKTLECHNENHLRALDKKKRPQIIWSNQTIRRVCFSVFVRSQCVNFSPLKSNHFSHTWERSMRSCALRWAGTAGGTRPLLGRNTTGEVFQ